ncbi:hypothetical protein FHT87_003669 [Rhizobium sp. BK316]|nr:hypothetical protein [Rhizobium sp. BK316]
MVGAVVAHLIKNAPQSAPTQTPARPLIAPGGFCALLPHYSCRLPADALNRRRPCLTCRVIKFLRMTVTNTWTRA